MRLTVPGIGMTEESRMSEATLGKTRNLCVHTRDRGWVDAGGDHRAEKRADRGSRGARRAPAGLRLCPTA